MLRSKIVHPGSYYLYFLDEIILNEIPNNDAIFGDNWVTINDIGYFEGTSREDVKFIKCEKKSNIIIEPGTKLEKRKETRIDSVNEIIKSGLIFPYDFAILKNLMHYQLSQEEIDAIVKELKDGYESIPSHNKQEIEKKKTESKETCIFHEWVSYQGLNEQFEFCKKCDIKRK